MESIQSEEPVMIVNNNLMTFEDNIGESDVDYNPQMRDDSQNPYIDPQVSNLLERPLLFKRVEWNSNQPFETRIIDDNIIPWWLAQSYPGVILSKFRYFACDFKIRIQVQSTMMHYGKLAVAWLPCVTTAPVAVNTRALFALDVNYIDAAQPKVLEINIPYMYPLKWWSVNDFFQATDMALGPHLYVDVLAPLGNAQAVSSIVPVSIYVTATNIRLAGPVNLVTSCPTTKSFFQSELNGDLKVKERGYIRSAIDSVPTFVSVKQVAPMGQSLEEDSTVRLALAASTTAEVTKDMVQSLLPEEHNVLNICRRPVCYPMVTVTSASTGSIGSWLVHPSFYKIPVKDDVLTNMNIVSRLAVYYHGSMKYAFSFSCAHVSTMRIAAIVSYETNTAGITDNRVAALWDITGSTIKTLEIPYLSNYPYTPTFDGNVEFDLTQLPRYGVPSVRLEIVNALTNGSISTVTPSCYINVFASAGEDFRLFLPRGFDGHFQNNSVVSYDQDNIGEIFKEKFEILGTNGTVINLPEFNFGEELIDIMDLLTRYSTITPAQTTLTRSIPKPYKDLFRFARYGMRYKILDATTSRTVFYSTGTILGDRPPFDTVPSPTDSVLQFDLPFYEAWYYDLPLTKPTSTAQVPGNVNTWSTYACLSADSVLSFWTFAAKSTYEPPLLKSPNTNLNVLSRSTLY